MKWRERLYESYQSHQGRTLPEAGADPEQWFEPRLPHVRAIVDRHVPSGRGQEILDLGCGAGAYVYALRESGYLNVRGVDRSPEQVEIAGRLGIGGVSRSMLLPYLETQDANSVDVVLAIDLLEHLSRQKLFKLLDEVARVLRPGARLIAHVPNAAGLFGSCVRYSDLTHELAFTESSLRQLFRSTGFGKIACYEDKPVVHGGASLLRRLTWTVATIPARLSYMAETGRLRTILSQNLVAVARRR